MSDSEIIGSDSPLSPSAQSALKRLLRAMIPASEEFAVPGADDDAIFADILRTGGGQLAVANPLLESLAKQIPDYPETEDGGDPLAEQFRREHADLAGLLTMLTMQCYYRDDRVMRSLEMPVRAPFPEGYEIDDGDYSLLDPVRARGRIYRQVPDGT
jgi:hypothetical protein